MDSKSKSEMDLLSDGKVLNKNVETMQVRSMSDPLQQLVSLMQTMVYLQIQNNVASMTKPKPPLQKQEHKQQSLMMEDGKSGPTLIVLVRWTLTDSFFDSEKEAMTVPHNSTAHQLRATLDRESTFVRRYCEDRKLSAFDWSAFDLTLGELAYATVLPSFRFTRSEYIVDVLPRERIPLRIMNEQGHTQWMFESSTTRRRREFEEQNRQTQHHPPADPTHSSH